MPLSPLVDLVDSYQVSHWGEGADVRDLFLALPDIAVHVYFAVVIALLRMALHKLRSGRSVSSIRRRSAYEVTPAGLGPCRRSTVRFGS